MSTFGSIFRVTTYGESHCESVGCIVDGCPAGLPLSNEIIQPQLSRRRPGQSALTTDRNEADQVKIQSGVEDGFTLGSPIAIRVLNLDHRPKDYSETDLYPRPSHADWTYLLKYGRKSKSGGGRSSARETIGRVAAGAIAAHYLQLAHQTEIIAFVSSAGNVKMPFLEENGVGLAAVSFQQFLSTITREEVDAELTRCPEPVTAEKMKKAIVEAKAANDSIGGTITCVIRNVPTGLGEPCFDKLEAMLAHAMLSIPATKGFEIGSGFRGTESKGSEHNDVFVCDGVGKLRTETNNSGGIQGGITNGENIYFRVAFKPVATICQAQETAKYTGEPGILSAAGRHDPCVLPRAIPIVESMAALVMMDALMMQNARKASADALLPGSRKLNIV